jgi:hypothetical protein
MAKRRSRRNKRSRRRNRRSRNKRGGRRRSRRRRKQRGGGYGFNPNIMPNWGKKSINWRKIPSTCGISSKSNMNAAKQYAPLVQHGGGLDSLGHSLGGGGKISYGYGPKGAQFTQELRGGYAPISRTVRPQCGSGKRRSRRRRRTRRKRRRRRRRRQRGGYHQYQSNKPLTSGYSVGGKKGNWTLANPPPITRTNYCADNYNHYKKKGSASPVLDQAAQY